MYKNIVNMLVIVTSMFWVNFGSAYASHSITVQQDPLCGHNYRNYECSSKASVVKDFYDNNDIDDQIASLLADIEQAKDFAIFRVSDTFSVSDMRHPAENQKQLIAVIRQIVQEELASEISLP